MIESTVNMTAYYSQEGFTSEEIHQGEALFRRIVEEQIHTVQSKEEASQNDRKAIAKDFAFGVTTPVGASSLLAYHCLLVETDPWTRYLLFTKLLYYVQQGTCR